MEFNSKTILNVDDWVEIMNKDILVITIGLLHNKYE